MEEGAGDAESGGAGAPVAAADPDGDTLTYSLGGDDAGSFEIDASTGQLWSKASLDYETQANYSLIVSVQDGRDFNGDPDTAVDASVTVTVAVVNVGEPGALALLSSQPRVGVPFAARLTDPDGVVGEVVWKWERSRDGNPWSSSWRAISGAESSAYAPVDGDVGYYLRVTASYEDGHGPDKSRQAISEGRVMEFTGPVPPDPPIEVRITAQRLEDGRTEFAIQQREGDGWSDRIAPRARFLPAEPPLDRWLVSTPVTIAVPTEVEVRIAARRLEDGRIEFALQQRQGDGWSDRIAPPARFLPAEPPLGRWLVSTPVTIAADGEG